MPETTLNLEALGALVDEAKESTRLVQESGEQASKLLDFSSLSESFSLQPEGRRPATNFNINKPDPNNKNIMVCINWLLSLNTTLIKKINEQSNMLSTALKLQEESMARVEEVERKAKEQEVKCQQLEVKVEKLEVEEDFVRQQHLIGQITISSPALPGKASLAIKPIRSDEEGGFKGVERHIDTALRMYEAKTGRKLPKSAVYKCHPIGKKKVGGREGFAGFPDTYMLGISQRCPGSEWDVLQHALMTGKDLNNPSDDSTPFFSKENVYINNLLTPKRSKLLVEVVKPARKAGKITGYCVDQLGGIRVRVGQGRGRWHTITTLEGFNNIIGAR